MSDQTTTIPKGWKMTTLAEVLDIKNGKSRPKDGEKYPVYGGNGVFGYADEYNIDRELIVVGRVGAYCGCVYFEKEKFWLSDNALGVLAKENSDIYFLYYLLVKLNLNKQSIGGAQPLLTQAVINQIEVIFPEEKTEQCAIAAVLLSLDDKIKLLQKQNETLEQVAQTIFDEWFVKKIDGRELPEGWGVKGLSGIADFLNGIALQKYPATDPVNYLPAIKIKEINSGITEATDKVSKNVPEKYVVKNGDVLFSWSGSLEVTIWKHGTGALNQHLFKVSSEKYPKWFFYFWLLHHLPNFRSIAANKATTMGHIQRYHLDQAEVVVPDDLSLETMDTIFAPVFNKIIANNAQINELVSILDSLIPKLMSGEIRVKS